MKRVALLLLGLLFLPVLAAAYQVNIEAPDSLAVGKPLIVTGTTTIGVGTPIDVVLYHQLTTTTEIQRKIVYVQSDKTFKTVFDTTGLKPGTYKVEVPSPSHSDSVSMRLVTIFDRTDDISLASPSNQSFSGKIHLSGQIKGDENSGVQIEVIDTYGLVVYGPQYINMDNAAHFAADIPVAEPGAYEISFTDADGYIGSRTVTVTGNAAVPGPVSTTVTVPTASIVLSSHARSSRDSPAYFIVTTGNGPVTLYTSKSVDWVIEYVDDRGVLHMENNQGEQSAETAEFQGRGKTIYVKVYPYKYSVTGDVFLYGENVNAVLTSQTVPEPFAAAVPGTTTAAEAPLAPVPGIVAVALALFLFRCR